MSRCFVAVQLFLIAFCATVGLSLAAAEDAPKETEAKSFPEVVKEIRARRPESEQALKQLAEQCPMQFDWLVQDLGEACAGVLTGSVPELEKKALDSVYEELDGTAPTPGTDEWPAVYEKSAMQRRAKRLAPVLEQCDKMVFVKHYITGASHYAYTEALSDAQHERVFVPGAALCILDLKTLKVETLLEDRQGVIRDPDVSFDGKKVLFSWKKSNHQDDFHLYEMEVATKEIRQITFGLGFADYECIYLPGGDILFNSTRCIQTTDCWFTETSSIYRCDKDGKYMRRLGYDQVATNYPQLLDDGRVVYTRWDYNDRGQLYPQPLFQMNPDGTSQTEYYGNNSWFPTTIMHARGVPGSHKVIALSSGHHTRQRGKLIVIDNLVGRQEGKGIDYLNPRKPSKAIRVDAADQDGDQYQYPYPLSEKHIIASFAGEKYIKARGINIEGAGRRSGMGLFYINGDTPAREFLYIDKELSSGQAMPLAPRRQIYRRPSLVDYHQNDGTFYVQDVYEGPGLKGIPRGTIKKIRVIALSFRETNICSNANGGPAGWSLVSLPCSYHGCSWDVKTILGDAKVHDDGSAYFKVPARLPVYFQCLDAENRCVQTMRSWATLMPGEMFGCVGCHEDKNATPIPNLSVTKAFRAGAGELEPFYGPARGFSFVKEVQPILDKHCVKCHKPGGEDEDYDLTSTRVHGEGSGRLWTQGYVTLTEKGRSNKWVNWISVQSIPPMIPPKSGGSTKSGLFELLQDHYKVKLSREDLDKLAAWMDLVVPYTGDYLEENAWTDQHALKFERFQNKRHYMEAIERQNIEEFVSMKDSTPFTFPPSKEKNPYRNVALNSSDVQGESDKFPHATSNSECRGEACFAANNCIDGNRENRGHGSKFPSWGPEKAKDIWWQVDFGKEIQTDRIAIFIRADFPHDGYWENVTAEFSDGSKVELKLDKTHGRQTFYFPNRTTTFVKLTNFRQPGDANRWCALSEVEVWGRDPRPKLNLAYSGSQLEKDWIIEQERRREEHRRKQEERRRKEAAEKAKKK